MKNILLKQIFKRGQDLEWSSIDGISSTSCSCWISSLNNELLHNTMECCVVIVTCQTEKDMYNEIMLTVKSADQMFPKNIDAKSQQGWRDTSSTLSTRMTSCHSNRCFRKYKVTKLMMAGWSFGQKTSGWPWDLFSSAF